MSESKDDPTFSLGALNICTGGIQINVFGADERRDPFRHRLLFDGYWATTRDGNQQGDYWCVAGTSGGVGTLVGFSVVYASLNPGTTIYARVYDGLMAQPTEAYISGDPRYVMGTPDSTCRYWTWNLALTGVTFSTPGIPHHVRVFKVFNKMGTRDDAVSFLAVPCSGSGSYSLPAPASQIPLTHVLALGMDVTDGKYAGHHSAEQIGRLLWGIVTGPLKGLVEFTAHSSGLSVRTPNGHQTFPVSGERPFSVVIPGDLFGSSRDVVVTAP